ncbi:MAG: hypothetical protein COA73_10145 [Candidatus Hydrogenedentota bacterium]|nr:MAG: hypothetical protein COA73_10145 [Candidatus Hydrogenedentota bacterium]
MSATTTMEIEIQPDETRLLYTNCLDSKQIVVAHIFISHISIRNTHILIKVGEREVDRIESIGTGTSIRLHGNETLCLSAIPEHTVEIKFQLTIDAYSV